MLHFSHIKILFTLLLHYFWSLCSLWRHFLSSQQSEASNAPHLSSWLRLNDEKRRKLLMTFMGISGSSFHVFVFLYQFFAFPSKWIVFPPIEIDSDWKDFHKFSSKLRHRKAFVCFGVGAPIHTHMTNQQVTFNNEKLSLLFSAKTNLENSLTQNIDFLYIFFGIDKNGARVNWICFYELFMGNWWSFLRREKIG